jgi:DivIVA domain-containing protein
VRAVVFAKPQIGKRGYNEDDVDALMERIVARLEGRGRLTAKDVQQARFSKPEIFKRGYREDVVDEFLEQAVATIEALDRR